MDPSIDYSALPLRDIRLPEPVSWWPPAPGWWLLLAMSLVALGLVLWHRRRTRRRRAALAEISRIREALDAGAAPVDALKALSIVLRRFAISTAGSAGAHTVPGLVGMRWLEYLDAHSGGTRFRDGPGRLLLDAPYAPPDAVRADDAREIGDLLAGWIKTYRPGD